MTIKVNLFLNDIKVNPADIEISGNDTIDRIVNHIYDEMTSDNENVA